VGTFVWWGSEGKEAVLGELEGEGEVVPETLK